MAAVDEAQPAGPSIRTWLHAARPKTLYAAAAPVLMGGALALADDGFRSLPFLAALVCALLIQIGTNLANDYSDFVRGADTEERQGFTRVTQAGWVGPSAMRKAISLIFVLALAIGAYLVYVGGWPILLVGSMAIAAGLAYTGGPWPFGYHGLGDLFVLLFFGWVAVAGTYYVQTLQLNPSALLAGTGIGALVTAILVVNNLRDRETDGRAGKRTLAVRLGDRGSRLEYTVLLAVAALVPAVGVGLGRWPAGALAALAVAPLAVRPLRSVWRFEDRRTLNATLAETSRLAGLYALLFAVGLAV